MDDFSRFDRHGASDHVCRIPRQRAGVSNSTLPLPAGKYPFSTDSTRPYLVLTRSLDEIWRTVAFGRFVDVLKVDVDQNWDLLEPELVPLLAAQALGVLTLEVDRNIGGRAWQIVERINCLLWQFGFALFLKVPCAGGGGADAARDNIPLWSQRTAYMPLSGRWHTRLPIGWARQRDRPCSMGGHAKWVDCATQDLLGLNLRRPELAGLIELGNADCGASFPHGVTHEWAHGAAPKAPHAVPAIGTLRGERERERMWLWGGPWRGKEDRPANRTALMLADGTWSCGGQKKPPAKAPSEVEMRMAVGPACR